MSRRTLQRLLTRLGQHVAPRDMKEWAAAMAREIEEIDDPRAALDWAAACFVSCVAQRLRAVLRIAATGARFVLGGYCLVVAGQVGLAIVKQIAQGRADPWTLGSWLLIGVLFGATAPLVALRRRAAAWTLGGATATVAVVFSVNVVGAAPPDTASQELIAAATMTGAFLLLTGVAFWLTRRPDTHLTI